MERGWRSAENSPGRNEDEKALKEQLANEKQQRRVSFAATNRVRVFQKEEESSEKNSPEETLKIDALDENPFIGCKQDETRRLSSPLSRSTTALEMDLTERVGGILQEDKQNFVEQLSPIIVSKELPKRLSWFLNPNEEMCITENVGKILDDDGGKNEEMPLIRDIPEPLFDVVNSPFTAGSKRRPEPLKVESPRRSSTRLSLGSRLDAFPTPLFPRARTSVGEKIKAPSPCLETAPPEVSLKEFLAQTGIRFLDGLTSFTRRDTLLFDKNEETPFTEKEHLVQCLVQGPEHRIYEEGCMKLLTLLKKAREAVTSLEEEFGFNRPILYDKFQTGTESRKEEIILALKTLKSAARSKAKAQWYKWRWNYTGQLEEFFAEQLGWVIVTEERVLKQKEMVLECSEQSSQLLQELVEEVAEIKEKAEAYHTMDWARFRELEVLIEEQLQEMTRMSALLPERERCCAMDEATLSEISLKEAELEKQLEQYSEIYKMHEEPLSQLVGRLELGYHTLSSLAGWQFRRIQQDTIELAPLGDIPLAIRISLGAGLQCEGVQFSTEHNDSFSHRCVKILQGKNWEQPLRECMAEILKHLDSWGTLRRELRQLRLLAAVKDITGREGHVYKITVLQKKAGRRLDILFDATEYPNVKLLESTTVYGELYAAEVVQRLKDSAERNVQESSGFFVSFVSLLSTEQ